jgi:hypothetical protein
VLLFGCGQASSPVEKQEKRGGVEQAAELEPSAPDTPQEINALSDSETIALGECQLHKMAEDRGIYLHTQRGPRGGSISKRLGQC